MIANLTAVWNRAFALLGRVSMYRTAFLALAALAVIAFALSFAGLVAPNPLQLVVTAAVLAIVCGAVDAGAQRLLRLPWRVESSLITAGILLFVLRPTIDPLGLVGIAIAGVAASGSKYVLAYRGRHIFNPAAVGAAVVAIIVAVSSAYGLGGPSWWVGTPALGPIVLLLGLVVLIRAEKVRVVALFWVVAIVLSIVRTAIEVGGAMSFAEIVSQQLWSSPFLFLGAFMVSEPLTQPPRRWQALTVAAVVGVLAGWPIDLGVLTLGQERALLIGNLIAFAFSVRSAVRLVLEGRSNPTPTTQELTFRTKRRLSFLAGQFLELEVPHRHPDARGTRREFSIVSAPEDQPIVRIAFRDDAAGSPHKAQSSYKRALAAASVGDTLAVTGVWGDFLLPRGADSRILLVAAGIGVTPFISQLRHLQSTGVRRDVVLVYAASQSAELAYRGEIEDAGIPVVVFTRDEPRDLPAQWTWAGGMRIDAEGLHAAVPDLRERHALVSGPAALIADLAPALDHAKSLTTDAFSGY